MAYSETLYTRTVIINKLSSFPIPPRFRPLLRKTVLAHGRNQIRFNVRSVRMNGLLGKFTKLFRRRIKISASLASIEKTL